MQITPTDLSTLTFSPIKNEEVTQRVFTVINHSGQDNEVSYLVLVHIDKKQNDIDGDGTPDTLDGKFCLSIINADGTPELSAGKEIKISQVHSVSVEKISDGTIDMVEWVTEKSNELIPVVVNKKATLAAWGGF